MNQSISWLSNIRCIVSDFDDTFMRGSEGVKRDAWKTLFIEKALYERYLEAQSDVSKGNKGGRRYIIAYTLMCSEDDDIVRTYELKFDEIVQKKIIEQGIALEDLSALEELKSSGYRVYLMSGTPQEALVRTLRDLSEKHAANLFDLFDLVLGQPYTKVENFSLIRNHSQVSFTQMVKVGDSQADLLVARTVGTYFIGVTTPRNEEMWEQENFPKITSFSELIDLFPVVTNC